MHIAQYGLLRAPMCVIYLFPESVKLDRMYDAPAMSAPLGAGNHRRWWWGDDYFAVGD